MLKIMNGIFEPEYFLDLVLFTVVPFVTEKNNFGMRNNIKNKIHKQMNLHKIYSHKIDIVDHDNDQSLLFMIRIKPTIISPTFSWSIEMKLKAWNPVLYCELTENDRLEQFLGTKFVIVRLQ